MYGIQIYGNPTQTTHMRELRTFMASLATAAPAPDFLEAEPDYLEFLRRVAPESACRIGAIDRKATSPRKAMLALSIGGDGTFLKTANIVGASGTPIMGINSGHLGYLSATDITAADAVTSLIVAGLFSTEPRSTIEVCSTSPMLPERPFALNEVAILKRDTASMITVETAVDSRPLATYSGDGLIIATPTGSTGYNMSVGGPVMSPRCSAWVISPVAPHSLSMRPLVVPDSISLDVKARARTSSMLLAIDGRSTPLPVDTPLTLRRATFDINVAHLPGHSFIDALRHKLHWASDR